MKALQTLYLYARKLNEIDPVKALYFLKTVLTTNTAVTKKTIEAVWTTSQGGYKLTNYLSSMDLYTDLESLMYAHYSMNFAWNNNIA